MKALLVFFIFLVMISQSFAQELAKQKFQLTHHDSVWVTIDAEKRLSFVTVNQQHQTQKLYPEFAGPIFVDGDALYLEDIQVGAVDFERKQVSLCSGQWARLCTLAIGLKHDEALSGPRSVATLLLSWNLPAWKGSGLKNETLLPYALPSPNQEDAGSCLFMALTGSVEILMNQLNGVTRPVSDGDYDYSERFLMNANRGDSAVKNWRTDLIYQFNGEGGALLNRDYRYTKGWYKETGSSDNLVHATKGEPGAEYGARFNWIDDYTSSSTLRSKVKKLPSLTRSLVFVDPESNVWNVGILNDGVIAKIKKEMDRTQAPAVVIYNHYGYWHAVIIVGYDDAKISNGCAMVDSWKEYTSEEAKKLIASGNAAKIKKGEAMLKQVEKVSTAQAAQGGCSQQGVFYVRDSIYRGPDDAVYDYDLSQTGEEQPYSKRIIERSYDWLKYLGNHAFVVHRKISGLEESDEMMTD